MSAKLSTAVLDVTSHERRILKNSLSARWVTLCRHARLAERIGNANVASIYRLRADETMDLSLKLGLGLLPISDAEQDL